MENKNGNKKGPSGPGGKSEGHLPQGTVLTEWCGPVLKGNVPTLVVCESSEGCIERLDVLLSSGDPTTDLSLSIRHRAPRYTAKHPRHLGSGQGQEHELDRNQGV